MQEENGGEEKERSDFQLKEFDSDTSGRNSEKPDHSPSLLLDLFAANTTTAPTPCSYFHTSSLYHTMFCSKIPPHDKHESIPRAHLDRPSQPPRRRLLKNAVVHHVQRLSHNVKHAEIIASRSRPLDQDDHCGAPGLQNLEPVVRLGVEETGSGRDEAEGDGGVLGRDVGGARFGAVAAGGAERRDRGSIVAPVDGFEESLGERCEIVPQSQRQ